jgi:hypothetical protein
VYVIITTPVTAQNVEIIIGGEPPPWKQSLFGKRDLPELAKCVGIIGPS